MYCTILDWMYEFNSDITMQENDKGKAFQEVCKNFRFTGFHRSTLNEVFITLCCLHSCFVSGLSCIIFSWRGFYTHLTGLKNGLLTHEVWQLVQW